MQKRARGTKGVGAFDDEGEGVSVAKTNSGESMLEIVSKKADRHGAGLEEVDKEANDIFA